MKDGYGTFLIVLFEFQLSPTRVITRVKHVRMCNKTIITFHY